MTFVQNNLSYEKYLKKIFRKERKMMNVCAKLLDVEITRSTPSKWLIIWGVGLSEGTTKSNVQDILQCEIEEIRMYSNKAITCVLFKDMDDAISSKLNLSGSRLSNDQVIYCGYLATEPPLEDTDLIRPFLNSMPDGLTLIPDFISVEEEAIILNETIPKELSGCVPFSNVGTDLKKRWVCHYGYDFRYGTNDVDINAPLNDPMPASVSSVISKMLDNHIVKERPQQVTLNHYLPGQGIPPHVDTHSAFENPIISLSLLAPTVMDFRKEGEHFSLILPRRSLLIMSDSSRYEWKHSIANRTFDVIFDKKWNGNDVLSRKIRVSLTFRILREGKICDCKFPSLCDSQKAKISEENALELENTLVHKVYEQIAGHFSDTRHTPWPRIKEFVSDLNPGTVLLDVGCGNGKYFGINKNILEIGTDMSGGLLDKCIEKHETSDAVRANALTLPFKDSSVDVVVCIAVIHHLSTKERRIAALSEIMRVLRHEGQALIYVWAKNQKLSDRESCYAAKQERRKEPPKNYLDTFNESLSDWSFLPIYNHEVNFTDNDLLVPWVNDQSKDATSVHHRFYHVFNQEELESLVLELSPSPKILDSYYDQGNWCVKIEKSY